MDGFGRDYTEADLALMPSKEEQAAWATTPIPGFGEKMKAPESAFDIDDIIWSDEASKTITPAMLVDDDEIPFP
jgi:hypothetical protein